MLNLRNFREQKVQGEATRQTYSPARIWRGSPNLRGHGDRNSFLSRDPLYNAHGIGCQLDDLWLFDTEQKKNHPYLLDWFYTSRYQSADEHIVDIHSLAKKETEQHSGDYWVPPNFAPNEDGYGEYWGSSSDNFHDRSQSHLVASTSAPFFRESVLKHLDSDDSEHPTRSHWWARSGPNVTQPQASFLEPPDFNQYTTSDTNYYDNLSEKSIDDQEKLLDLRNSRKLSRTMFMDELEIREDDDVDLHFDDVYTRPPESPNVNLKLPSFK